MQSITNEINFLQKLSSKFLIRIHEVYKMDETHYGLILEYIEGPTLWEIIT